MKIAHGNGTNPYDCTSTNCYMLMVADHKIRIYIHVILVHVQVMMEPIHVNMVPTHGIQVHVYVIVLPANVILVYVYVMMEPVHAGLQIYGGPGSLSNDFKIWPITFQGSMPSEPIVLSCEKISLK